MSAKSWPVLAALALVPTTALGQSVAPVDPHAGHQMAASPETAAGPQADHDMLAMSPPASDPHAGHQMGAPAPADPRAGHDMSAPADPHAGHHMAMGPKPPSAPPPPVPTDKAAEQFYSAGQMAASRQQLAVEHGGGRYWTVRLETAEWRPEGDGLAWEGEAWYGDDVHRVTLKTKGEGASGEADKAEAQVLYSRAIGPYFDLQAGVRQDLADGPKRTYGVIGFEGVAPYWFEVEGAAFLSDKGDVTARFEVSYDLRLTQRLVLEPRAEVELAAQDVAALQLGSGVTSLETGLRLRYAVTPEFAPYVGVSHQRSVGETADRVRAMGDHADDTTVVIGVRAWF